MNNTTIAVNAIVAALALLGVVMVTVVTIPIQQQAEAGRPPGYGASCTQGSAVYNASSIHCFHP